MDPDANFIERIKLVREAIAAGEWADTAQWRYDELTEAYAGWRAAGGFVADKALRATLCALDAEMRALKA